MNKNISTTISKYTLDISQAKENGYEGILLPLFYDEDAISLTNISDNEYIYELSSDIGWDRIIVLNFLNNKSKQINIDDIQVA